MIPRLSLFWKKTPFLKIVLPTISGVIIQWYLNPPILCWMLCVLIAAVISLLYTFSSLFSKFRLAYISGICAAAAFASLGGWITREKNITQDVHWFGNYLNNSDQKIIATLAEPISEKPKSFKVLVNVNYIAEGQTMIRCKGKMIVYVVKDNCILRYGNHIAFTKRPVEIKNFTADFNYRQFCLFRGITHQAFLKTEDYKIIFSQERKALWPFIYASNVKVLSIIKKYIKGTRETGLAEALLIGFKDDLDKSLVKSYTNTGVVHIIAISGLHLGLIYLLLSYITKPLASKRLIWLRPLLLISFLWVFTLMAGAQPSILRSALMFTCMALGELFSRKTSVYNSLSISAFIIICINPFALWDVGFQLSYAAVLSILVFMKPIYNLLYIENKLIDSIWKLNAITISAQILTVPLCIYHFHQFPNFFILSNFVAVPLSSLVLFTEILLCCLCFLPFLASFVGNTCSFLIRCMNNYIEMIESLPFSVTHGLTMKFIQMLIMYIFIATSSVWLMEKKPSALKYSLLAILAYLIVVIRNLLL